MTLASNDMKYGKLAEEVSREKHMKNISPVESISPDTSMGTFFIYNNKVHNMLHQDYQINKVVHSTSNAMY